MAELGPHHSDPNLGFKSYGFMVFVCLFEMRVWLPETFICYDYVS